MKFYLVSKVVVLSLVFCVLVPRARSAEEKGKWIVCSDGLEVEQKGKDGAVTKTKKPPSGSAVDRTTGSLYMHVQGSGVNVSTDKGKTFSVLKAGTGYCETGFNFCMDPANGKRLLCFMLRGPSFLTLDGGKAWLPIKGDGDWVVADWSDPEVKTMICKWHGGGIGLSTDQGKTWKKLDQPAGMGGIFDAKTFLVGDGKGIKRTEDGGTTWTDVPDMRARAIVMQVFKGVGYYLAREGLMVNKDKGKTWTKLAIPSQCGWGPFFGKDEKQMMIAGPEGFFTSADGGQTWKNVAPLPEKKEVWPWPEVYDGNNGWSMACGWDPIADILYCGARDRPVFKFER